MTQTALDKLVAGLKSVDLNKNGVPDYEDPAAWGFVLHLIALGVLKVSPKTHPTLAKDIAARVEEVTR